MKYNTGASNLGGSLGGESEAIFDKGYADVTPTKASKWDYPRKEDESGNTQEGDRWGFMDTGAAGRPRGNER